MSIFKTKLFSVLGLTVITACGPSSDNATKRSILDKNHVQRCPLDELTLRADLFLSQISSVDIQSLERDFGLPPQVAAYILDAKPEGLGATNVFNSPSSASYLLPGGYENGELVIFTDQSHGDELQDLEFLRTEKFSSYVVCHFVCGADENWRLSQKTCFEETGDPFNNEYEL